MKVASISQMIFYFLVCLFVAKCLFPTEQAVVHGVMCAAWASISDTLSMTGRLQTSCSVALVAKHSFNDSGVSGCGWWTQMPSVSKGADIACACLLLHVCLPVKNEDFRQITSFDIESGFSPIFHLLLLSLTTFLNCNHLRLLDDEYPKIQFRFINFKQKMKHTSSVAFPCL